MNSKSCIGSILITGATSGIGLSTLKEFHRKVEFIEVTPTYMTESKPRRNVIN